MKQDRDGMESQGARLQLPGVMLNLQLRCPYFFALSRALLHAQCDALPTKAALQDSSRRPLTFYCYLAVVCPVYGIADFASKVLIVECIMGRSQKTGREY